MEVSMYDCILPADVCFRSAPASIGLHRMRVKPRIQDMYCRKQQKSMLMRASEGKDDAEMSPAQKMIQERIRKAQEYKSQPRPSKTETASPSPSSTASADMQTPNEGIASVEQAAMDEYNRRLMDYGAQLASSQQQALSSALEDLKSQPAGTRDSQGESQQNADMLQKARQLAAEKAEQVNASLYAQINRTTAVPQVDSFSRAKDDPDASGGQFPETLENREAALSGSADEAASYLKRVMSSGKSEDADLRPEQFTMKRDEEMKAKGVDFIASDKGYNPLLQQDRASYRPKTASWGMYPRPADISEAYGGGRTYKPGEALETSEQEETRRNKTAAALLEYRKKMGLFIDSESEAKWTAVYQNGSSLMQAGQLATAVTVFEDVINNVSLRTKLGGEAQLQRAICLDSLGRNDEAYKLYMQLERHPSPEVQKRTKRMIFGFRAAENLKANTMSYAIGAKGSKEWDKYFTKLAGEWDSGYVAPSEDSTLSTIIATSVILLPLLAVAYFILT